MTKCWRTDIGLWEQRTGRTWTYWIWIDGRALTMRHRNRRRRGTVRTMCAPADIGTDYFGALEFASKYHGNKWSIPINRTFMPELP